MIGVIENVKGNVKATAMVADSPGIAPATVPIVIPTNNAKKLSRLATSENPAIILSIKLMVASHNHLAELQHLQHEQKINKE